MSSSVASPSVSKKKSFVSSSKRTGRLREEDEEEALEARLFGKRKQRKTASKVDVDGDDTYDAADTGLGWMQDSELFEVDLPAVAPGDDVSEDDFDNEPTIEFMEEPAEHVQQSAPRENKQTLWQDPADESVTVSLKSSKRTRKLARGKEGVDRVSGNDLQSKLREQFERLHPKPEWAERRLDSKMPTMQRLLASTASFVSTEALGDRRPPLPTSTLDIQRLRNANASTGEDGSSAGVAGIVDLAWHPSPKMPVLATAGTDRRVRFYNIDGHTNAPLLTLHIPSLPLSRITFHPSGSSLLLTGSRPFYYSYDLASQKIIRSPRNLYGSAPTPSSPQSLERHRFSPDGALLAVAGRRGAVSVLEWSHGGSTGVVIGELKSGRGGIVADLSWSADGTELSVLGGRDGSEVEVWNVAERKIVRRWKDDHAYGGQIMRQHQSQYTAVGSSTGIVNLYQSSTLAAASAEGSSSVDPLKSLEHLTTPISAMAFHPSGELFVTASSAKQKQLKMYHLPTGTAFSNWPTNATPLGRVNSIGFSSAGDFMAVGNTKGAVLLWTLKHFAN